MSYFVHHTIVVTSGFDAPIERAHAEAKRLFSSGVSKITPYGKEGHRSFFVAPDGGKEGWEDSARGDGARESFVRWLVGDRKADPGGLEWVEVSFGADDLAQPVIVAHSGEYDFHGNPIYVRKEGQ